MGIAQGVQEGDQGVSEGRGWTHAWASNARSAGAGTAARGSARPMRSKGWRSKLLVGRKVTPLARRQKAQPHAADADALEAHHRQAHQRAHAADLPLPALGEHKAQLL